MSYQQLFDCLICMFDFYIANRFYIQSILVHLAKARGTPVENHWSKHSPWLGYVMHWYCAFFSSCF
jgi:hypothetical protein